MRKATIPAGIARAAALLSSDNANTKKHGVLRRVEIADGQIRAFSRGMSVMIRVDNMPDEGDGPLHVDAAELLNAAKSTGKKHPIVMLEVDEVADDKHAELRDDSAPKPRTLITYRGKGKNPITVSAEHDEGAPLPLQQLKFWGEEVPPNRVVWTAISDVRLKLLYDFVKASGVAVVNLGVPLQVNGEKVAMTTVGEDTAPDDELPILLQARANEDGNPVVIEGFLAPDDLTVPEMQLGLVKQTEEIPWFPITQTELESLAAETGSDDPQPVESSSPASSDSSLPPEIVELVTSVTPEQLETAVAIAMACDEHEELLPLIIQAVEELGG